MGYKTYEDQLLAALRTFDFYDENNCVAENIKKAVAGALAEDINSDLSKNVCVVDFGGGRPSDDYSWQHTVRAFFMVRATEDVAGQELTPMGQQVRDLVDALTGMFFPNNRLWGTTTKCRIINITEAFPYQRANFAWYAFFASFEIDEEMSRC